MKGNIKRVLAATALLVAVLMIAVSVFPGSAALAQGNNGNGNANSKAPYVKCVNGQLILYQWVQNASNKNQGQWTQASLGTCGSDTDAILNQLAKQHGLTRAQLDALVAVEFGAGGIPQGFDLQTWFNGYMANQNGNMNTSNSTTANSTGSNNNNTNQGQSANTGTNQGQSGNTSTSSNRSTGSNGGIGGAGAPSTLPTTGGEMSTVSPLVLALAAFLVLFGVGVYKVSATR